MLPLMSAKRIAIGTAMVALNATCADVLPAKFVLQVPTGDEAHETVKNIKELMDINGRIVIEDGEDFLHVDRAGIKDTEVDLIPGDWVYKIAISYRKGKKPDELIYDCNATGLDTTGKLLKAPFLEDFEKLEEAAMLKGECCLRVYVQRRLKKEIKLKRTKRSEKRGPRVRKNTAFDKKSKRRSQSQARRNGGRSGSNAGADRGGSRAAFAPRRDAITDGGVTGAEEDTFYSLVKLEGLEYEGRKDRAVFRCGKELLDAPVYDAVPVIAVGDMVKVWDTETKRPVITGKVEAILDDAYQIKAVNGTIFDAKVGNHTVALTDDETPVQQGSEDLISELNKLFDEICSDEDFEGFKKLFEQTRSGKIPNADDLASLFPTGLFSTMGRQNDDGPKIEDLLNQLFAGTEDGAEVSIEESLLGKDVAKMQEEMQCRINEVLSGQGMAAVVRLFDDNWEAIPEDMGKKIRPTIEKIREKSNIPESDRNEEEEKNLIKELLETMLGPEGRKLVEFIEQDRNEEDVMNLFKKLLETMLGPEGKKLVEFIEQMLNAMLGQNEARHHTGQSGGGPYPSKSAATGSKALVALDDPGENPVDMEKLIENLLPPEFAKEFKEMVGKIEAFQSEAGQADEDPAKVLFRMLCSMRGNIDAIPGQPANQPTSPSVATAPRTDSRPLLEKHRSRDANTDATDIQRESKKLCWGDEAEEAKPNEASAQGLSGQNFAGELFEPRSAYTSAGKLAEASSSSSAADMEAQPEPQCHFFRSAVSAALMAA